MLPKQSVSAGVMSKVLLMGVVLKLAGATAAMPGRNVFFSSQKDGFYTFAYVLLRLPLFLCVSNFVASLHVVSCALYAGAEGAICPGSISLAESGRLAAG